MRPAEMVQQMFRRCGYTVAILCLLMVAVKCTPSPPIEGETPATAATLQPTSGPGLDTATVKTTSGPGLDTATLQPTSGPGLDTATVKTTSGPGLDTATVKTTSGPGPDTATLQPTSGPGLDTATLQPTSGPGLDTATVKTTSGSGLDTATLKTTSGPGPDTATSQPTSGPGLDTVTLQPTSGPGLDTATVKITSGPGPDTATSQPTSGPGLDTATVKTTSGPGLDTATLQPTSGPGLDTATSQPTSGPGLDTATLQSTSGPGLDTVTLQPTSGPGLDTATSQPTSGPGPDTATLQSTSGPGMDTSCMAGCVEEYLSHMRLLPDRASESVIGDYICRFLRDYSECASFCRAEAVGLEIDYQILALCQDCRAANAFKCFIPIMQADPGDSSRNMSSVLTEAHICTAASVNRLDCPSTNQFIAHSFFWTYITRYLVPPALEQEALTREITPNNITECLAGYEDCSKEIISHNLEPKLNDFCRISAEATTCLTALRSGRCHDSPSTLTYVLMSLKAQSTPCPSPTHPSGPACGTPDHRYAPILESECRDFTQTVPGGAVFRQSCPPGTRFSVELCTCGHAATTTCGI